MVEAYEETGGNIVAVIEVPREQTSRYGVLDVVSDDGRLVRARGRRRKARPAEAPSTLTIIGRYIIQPEIFGHLANAEPGSGGEIQLTDALGKLIDDGPGVSWPALRRHGASIAATSSAFSKRRSRSACSTRSWGRGCARFCTPTSDRSSRRWPHRFRPDDPARIRHSRHRRADPVRRRRAGASGGPSRSMLGRSRGRRVAVGYDGRLTSPELEAALVDGLAEGGADVVRIGRGPTPMLYYAAATLRGRWRDHGHRLAQPARP